MKTSTQKHTFPIPKKIREEVHRIKCRAIKKYLIYSLMGGGGFFLLSMLSPGYRLDARVILMLSGLIALLPWLFFLSRIREYGTPFEGTIIKIDYELHFDTPWKTGTKTYKKCPEGWVLLVVLTINTTEGKLIRFKAAQCSPRQYNLVESIFHIGDKVGHIGILRENYFSVFFLEAERKDITICAVCGTCGPATNAVCISCGMPYIKRRDI